MGSSLTPQLLVAKFLSQPGIITPHNFLGVRQTAGLQSPAIINSANSAQKLFANFAQPLTGQNF